MNNRISSLLQYVYENIDYYKDLYNKNGISIADLNFLNFHKVPIVEKCDIIRYYEQFLFKEHMNYSNLIKQCTSGTSGLLLNVLWTPNDYLHSNKFLWSYRYRRYKISPSDKVLKFHTGTTKMQQYEKPPRIIENERKLSLSKLFLNMSDIEEYMYAICAFKPCWIDASPGVLYLFYLYMKRKKIKFPNTLKYIELSGEYLLELHRKQMEEYFSVPIVNQYGSRETNALAIECEYKNMHCLPNNYVEVLDDEYNRLENGNEGNIVVTNLYNKTMPFVRYNLGDRAIMHSGAECKCGNSYPIIELTSCRKSDYIITRDGRKIYCMIFIYVVNFINSIYENCILQYKIKQVDYEKFVAFLCLNERYSGSNDQILSLFIRLSNERLEFDARWEFKFFEYIFPDNNTGKINYFVNEMI